MTALELFRALAPLLAPALEDALGIRNACIAATRCAIEVGRSFGVEVAPLAVRAVIYNAAFASHVTAKQPWHKVNVDLWSAMDGSHSCGLGFPGRRELLGKESLTRAYPVETDNGRRGWPGHLIATGAGAFADFTIRQAERIELGIRTGPAVVGPFEKLPHDGGLYAWTLKNEYGATLHYWPIEDGSYLRAPDWTDEKRRKPVVAALIRALGHLKNR